MTQDVTLMSRRIPAMVIAAAAFLAPASAQAACKTSERPPTPTNVKWFATSDTTIALQWTVRKSDAVDINIDDLTTGKRAPGGGPGLFKGYSIFHEIRGLTENHTYRLTLYARTESGTEGCISATPVVMTTKTAKKVDADACRQYTAKAGRQRTEMLGRGCPADGARWSTDRNAHFMFCLNERLNGRTGDAVESKARDDAIQACHGHGCSGGICLPPSQTSSTGPASCPKFNPNQTPGQVLGASSCSNAYSYPSQTATGTQPSKAAQDAVLCLINAERTCRGLPALTINDKIVTAALGHALDAIRIRWWVNGADPHVNPQAPANVPKTRNDAIIYRVRTQAGYCPNPPHQWSVGENAYSASGSGTYSGTNFKCQQSCASPASAVDWWMNVSHAGHREAILDSQKKEIGIAAMGENAFPGSDNLPDRSTYVVDFGDCE
jgi:uncharacterized protein YkwD